VRDVAFRNTTNNGPALLIENCNDVRIDSVSLQGETSLGTAICFRANKEKILSGLHIHGVTARGVTTAGILLEHNGKATLNDYVISGNFASVVDHIQGKGSAVADNREQGEQP
jgi:hypothetical protein